MTFLEVQKGRTQNRKTMRMLLICYLGLCNLSMLAQDQRPNILLVIADDMGIDMLDGYPVGSVKPSTPTLDSLRFSGITFMNHWATPQCAPTRATIMSGKFGIKTGVMSVPGNLDTTHQSIFQALSTASNGEYATALIGKWHISNPPDYDHPQQLGVDHYEGIFRGGVDDYYNWEKVENGVISQEQQYVTSHLTDASIDWINQREEPWFLWLAHAAPHSPFQTPPENLYTYDDVNTDQGKYLASIEAMDYELNRLFSSIDNDVLENTIVIFMGDNGTPRSVSDIFSNGHAKGSLYEGGVRVPFIVTGKGVSRNGEEEYGLTHSVDIFATILELAGNQLDGGIYNSRSFKSALSCDGTVAKKYNYTDHESDGQLNYAIRSQDYKLITYGDGTQEFYDISSNVDETENLLGVLSAEQALIANELQSEAEIIRQGWSCNDGILNGIEQGIDYCENDCPVDNLSFTNIGCCDEPSSPSVYWEFLEDGKRNIYSNDYPNHNFCYNPNNIPEEKYYHFKIDLNPSLTSTLTSIIDENGRPQRYFGVANNGVIFAPAPAAPFIFENPNTGEYNWDWVFEPTTNQGEGMGLVRLDCASAHTGPQGYHYHGEMFEYVETIEPGLTEDDIIPTEPIHIGWASDGFPIFYKFGPDAEGNIKSLLPSYQLKSGTRPGDGIEAPCGAFSGKYTSDFEYLCGKGDLDECNGIESEVEINTALGPQVFTYFYVITSDFPQIPRCLKGNISLDFENQNEDLTGEDNDGDGFISLFDCNDDDSDINPNAKEVEGNDIDENCDGSLISDVDDSFARQITYGPNPSSGEITIFNPERASLQIEIVNQQGICIKKTTCQNNECTIIIDSPGLYFLKVQTSLGLEMIKPLVIIN